MDMKFDVNYVKPDDPNFVYDKVVDFSQQKKDTQNSWDEDNENEGDNSDQENYSDNWDD